MVIRDVGTERHKVGVFLENIIYSLRGINRTFRLHTCPTRTQYWNKSIAAEMERGVEDRNTVTNRPALDFPFFPLHHRPLRRR